ncbi:MAG: hypothetical protein KDJ50_09130 [Alphaproteobacteria bacterium]|nr:hypothetical protein [Alphaproteobacteria bacterium]
MEVFGSFPVFRRSSLTVIASPVRAKQSSGFLDRRVGLADLLAMTDKLCGPL